jgi:hypothetical protein
LAAIRGHKRVYETVAQVSAPADASAVDHETVSTDTAATTL